MSPELRIKYSPNYPELSIVSPKLRRGIQPITFEETLEVAFVENQVYKDFPADYKSHLAGIEMELIAAQINEQLKGSKRKNLSLGYYDEEGRLVGYILAYAGYDEEKKKEMIFVSDMAVMPEYRGKGGWLLRSFANQAAPLNLPVFANLRVGANGSYELIKQWAAWSGATIEESKPYEISKGVHAVDVFIPSDQLLKRRMSAPSKRAYVPKPDTEFEIAI